MRFAFSATHEELRAVARQFLSRVIPRGSASAASWAEIVGMGWLGLPVSEDDGGQGGDMVAVAVVAEECGRALLGGPLVPSLAAAAMIARHGTAAQRARLLPGIVSGRTIATTASDLMRVPAADLAHVVIAGDRIYENFATTAAEQIDLTRTSARVMPQDDGEPFEGDGAEDVLVAAAEAVGSAGGALEMAVSYAKIREQFGRPIGSFQAIKHKAADMACAVEAARLAVAYAAWTVEAGSADQTAAIRTAAALASEASLLCAAENIQIHGGIGVTWDHDAHLFYRRAVATHDSYGSAVEHRDALAASLLAGTAFTDRA